jgi:hypothetical protein
LKMDLTEGSETSTQLILTPGKYPKESIQDSEHGENLKSRVTYTSSAKMTRLNENIIVSGRGGDVAHLFSIRQVL